MLHPLEVASLLHRSHYPDHVVAAAVLHDVLEDSVWGAASANEIQAVRLSAIEHRTEAETEHMLIPQRLHGTIEMAPEKI